MGFIPNLYLLPKDRKPLTIADPMYGPVTLDAQEDGLVIDLMRSHSFKRLQQVHQHGISSVAGLLPGTPVNRYDHSVGAMLLVRKLGATVEEQAAASPLYKLLHDVAHTALSHVVDTVFGRVVHEDDKEEFLAMTNLRQIVEAHQFNPERIFEETNFSLLERDAPKLCADRVDYGCRDSVAFGFLTAPEAKEILDDLVDYKGEMCFRTVDLARQLAIAYMNSDEFAWSNPTHSALYVYAANAIREAVEVGQIVKEDLWLHPDLDFWALMTDSEYLSVQVLASKVTPHIRAVDASFPSTPGAEVIDELVFKTKARVLDPMIVVGSGEDKRVALSSLDTDYRARLEAYKLRKSSCVRWRIEKV